MSIKCETNLIIPRLIIIILRILITVKVIFVIVIEILRIVIVVDVIKIIPFRTGCRRRCLPFAGNYGVMSAKPWRSAAGVAVAGFCRRGIDNCVIIQQNIILQFSVKLICQSVIARVCYRERIIGTRSIEVEKNTSGSDGRALLGWNRWS